MYRKKFKHEDERPENCKKHKKNEEDTNKRKDICAHGLEEYC